VTSRKLTVQEAAEVLGTSVDAVRMRARRGSLEGGSALILTAGALLLSTGLLVGRSVIRRITSDTHSAAKQA
jgi:hypothetical protein